MSGNFDAFAISYTIDKTKSGLVASDPLNNQTETKQQVLSDTRYWTYYGTAVSEKNTAYDIYRDSQGLHIGEPGPDPTQFGDGSYSGYYAVSPDTNAVLVHAIITATNQPVLHNDFQSQLEIMTTSGQVNYLDCAAITNSDGTYWTLVHGYGDNIEASHFDTLWVDSSSNQPLTRECTVITNGANYLKLYMDGVMVYSSNTLSLNMPAPFNYYFQTMNSYHNQMRHGTFQDYYATTDEKITISGNPSNAGTVSIVDSTGQSLARSSITTGSATLDVGKYHFPIAGTIQVKDSSGGIIASSAQTIYGGDEFSVTTSGNPTAPQPPTNLSATATSQSQIDLSWSAPGNDGGSTITGYQIERSTDAGATWNVLTSYTGSSSTVYSDTGLSADTSYAYRVSAINSVGTSSPSNVASATTGVVSTVPQTPTGLAATATSSSQINLSWTAPTDNGGSQITGYQIERSQDNGTTWSDLVSNTGSTSTTYSDSGLNPSTTYTYRVSAINSVGNSSPSNTASATTTSIIATGITLSNTQSTSGTISSNTITISGFDTGSGSNRLLVVGVSANNNNVASVTFGGIALKNIAASFYNNDAEFWYLKNPSGAENVIVTMNGPTQSIVGAYAFSGVNQTLPISTHVIKHNANPNSPKISITTKYANDWVLDLPSIYGGSTLDKSTCTQQWNSNIPNAITGASSSTIVPAPGVVTCGWTASSADLWDDAAVEINAAR
ncbi:MAG TPA: fibronectin type III domain-containing protein [Candidatus Nitrosotalea sp.]|nr:fibronectin type III domain-containing protein [Candidatus Nitrosotalea sp.]